MACRFANDVLQFSEGKKEQLWESTGFRGAPVERSHGEIVVLTLPDNELLLDSRGEIRDGFRCGNSIFTNYLRNPGVSADLRIDAGGIICYNVANLVSR